MYCCSATSTDSPITAVTSNDSTTRPSTISTDIDSSRTLLLEVIVGLSLAVILLLLLILITIVLILLARKRKTTHSLIDKNINVITENPAYQSLGTYTVVGEGAHNDLRMYVSENTDAEGIQIETEINNSSEMVTTPNEAYPFCNEPHYEYIADVKPNEICHSEVTTTPNEAYGVVSTANDETSSDAMITAPSNNEGDHTPDAHQYEDVNAVTEAIVEINSREVLTSPNEAYSVRDQPLDATSPEYDYVHAFVNV